MNNNYADKLKGNFKREASNYPDWIIDRDLNKVIEEIEHEAFDRGYSTGYDIGKDSDFYDI